MKVKIQKTKLPYDTAQVLKELDTVDIDNFNLGLNKYIEFDGNKAKLDANMLRKVRFNKCYEFVKKQNYLIHGFVTQCYKVAKFRFKPYDRIIVGLGQESVREISMTLHWIYGIPYIPGQAIKGMLSSWMIAENAALDSNFKLIFGDEDDKGKVIFMDSYPVDNRLYIKHDILTPHYSNYYTGSRLPSDWQNPNPILFFTLGKVAFNIYLICLDKDIKDIKKLEIKGKRLEKWLEEAFKYGGIGAKTSLGYGTGSLCSMEGDE